MSLSGISTPHKRQFWRGHLQHPFHWQAGPKSWLTIWNPKQEAEDEGMGMGAKQVSFPSYWQHITTEKSPTANLSFTDFRGRNKKISEKITKMSVFPDGNESTKTSQELLWLCAAHTETPANIPKPPSTQALLLLFPIDPEVTDFSCCL